MAHFAHKLLCTMVLAYLLVPLGFAAPNQNPDTVSLTNQSEPVDAGTLVSIYEDSTGELTLLDIQKAPSDKWFKSRLGTPNFSYTPSVYWFKGYVKNTDFRRLNGLIEIANPLLDDIEYYFIIDSKVEHYFLSGSLHPFKNRSLPHRNFLFPFNLNEHEAGIFYIRVTSKSSLQVPIVVSPDFKFFEYDQLDLTGKSAYYGMMIIIILFNLFLLFSLREPVYLFYVLFIAGFSAQQFSIHGFMTANLFPNLPIIQEYSVLFFMPFTIFFAVMFTQYFLNLSKTAPRISKLYKAYAIACILIAIGVFILDYEIIGRTVALFTVIVSLSCVLVGPYLWLKGYTIARFYSLAWICVAGGTALLALNKLGYIPRTGFTENGLLFGSAAEAILLSLALADRLNMERNHRYDAQGEALQETKNRKIAEERLVYNALHHSVTGMPNRSYFEAWFDDNVSPDESRHFFAFGLIHLNRFHEINQTLGHNLGDGLFARVATQLNNVMAQHKEFIPIETSKNNTFYCSIIEGVHIGFAIDLSAGESPHLSIKVLLDALSEPIDYQDMLIDVGASGGWAIFDEDVKTPGSLIRNALIAIDIGCNKHSSITQYSHAINPYSEKRLTLVGELRNALENNKLELYFQPQLSLKSNKPSSMEALLRWFHPEHGAIPPDDFILMAEQSGIINPLTHWVLNEALSKIAILNGMGINQHVAINISAVNLRDTFFPNMVLKLLRKHNVDSSHLTLEVTETAMMHDPELALSVLHDLSNLGIRLSIDDFGTGHSSLSYIKRLPVQEIKIDRSFVMGMTQSKDDSIIVKTTVNMCHDLGLEVVAEGVETLDIQHRLEAMNCDYIQGYGLSYPLPFDELVTWLQKKPN